MSKFNEIVSIYLPSPLGSIWHNSMLVSQTQYFPGFPPIPLVELFLLYPSLKSGGSSGHRFRRLSLISSDSLPTLLLLREFKIPSKCKRLPSLCFQLRPRLCFRPRRPLSQLQLRGPSNPTVLKQYFKLKGQKTVWQPVPYPMPQASERETISGDMITGDYFLLSVSGTSTSIHGRWKNCQCFKNGLLSTLLGSTSIIP